MPTQPNNRRPLPPWLIVGLLVLLGSGIGFLSFKTHQRNIQQAPIAAYLLPIDNGSLVKHGWWPVKKLAVPAALHSGEQVAIPNGAKIKLVHADTGAAEIISGPAKIVLERKLPNETDALSSPLEEVIGKYRMSDHADRTIIFTSPVGVTRYLNPVITWETGADSKTYDIAVLDPADPYVPPRVATNVRPPVALADLETPQRRQLSFDRNYEIIIRETGSQQIAGGARFLTASDAQLENQIPSTPADLMSEACAAMARKPYRTGDAWIALSRLPADWAKSELGVRLRMRVATELFSATEIASANEDAAKIMRLR